MIPELLVGGLIVACETGQGRVEAVALDVGHWKFPKKLLDPKDDSSSGPTPDAMQTHRWIAEADGPCCGFRATSGRTIKKAQVPEFSNIPQLQMRMRIKNN
ncbi:hypothetical protein GO497_19700 [Acidovorax citrulli]|nr:hypothetical protein [Paracidovorax citrulli]